MPQNLTKEINMKQFKNEIFFFSLCVVVFLTSACTTDAVTPNIPPPPPTQDPGNDNPCEDGTISFANQVLPIMVSSCAYSGCHDAASHRDGVVLDTYENVRREVKPGDPNDSEIYEKLFEGGDEKMPPPPAASLSPEQTSILRNWILQGAENTNCGTPCDSTAASFSANIYPVLKDYCIGCHNSNRSDGGVNIETYDKVKAYADSGQLLGVIRHDDLFPNMPPIGSKLSECRIAQFEKWIAEGAVNN